MKSFKSFLEAEEKEKLLKIKWKREEDTPSTSARGLYKADALISDDGRWYISKTGNENPNIRKDRTYQADVQLYDMWWDDEQKAAAHKAGKISLKPTKQYPSLDAAKEAAEKWINK